MKRNADKFSLIDFGDGHGPVAARRHINPDGMPGGWVSDGAFVDSDSYVERSAAVYGSAMVVRSRILGKARVYGGAHVLCATVADHSEVSGDAFVYGIGSSLTGRAHVTDNATVNGVRVHDGLIAGCTQLRRADPGSGGSFAGLT